MSTIYPPSVGGYGGNPFNSIYADLTGGANLVSAFRNGSYAGGSATYASLYPPQAGGMTSYMPPSASSIQQYIPYIVLGIGALFIFMIFKKG